MVESKNLRPVHVTVMIGCVDIRNWLITFFNLTNSIGCHDFSEGSLTPFPCYFDPGMARAHSDETRLHGLVLGICRCLGCDVIGPAKGRE
jgi:hypothetical protein